MNAKFKQVPVEIIIPKCNQSVILAARRGGSSPAVAPPAPRRPTGSLLLGPFLPADEGLQ